MPPPGDLRPSLPPAYAVPDRNSDRHPIPARRPPGSTTNRYIGQTLAVGTPTVCGRPRV